MEIQLNTKNDSLVMNLKKVIHDLNSPLTVLRMMSSESTDLSDVDRHVLRDVVNRMNCIVESAIQNMTDNEYMMINVHNTLTKLMLEKEIEYSKSKVKVTYISSDETRDLVIKGNLVDFERMISNLLNNAVDACYDKGGMVIIRLKVIDNKLVLTIYDDGKGMPVGILEKLRDGRQPITYGKDNGNGVGFMQIRDTIKSLNGVLDIESIAGVGSKFSLQFDFNETKKCV